MLHTKIICTIGPASQSSSTLNAMMKAGMNAARLNLSHGTHSAHKKLLRLIRLSAKKLNNQIPIIADLQGPKIRLGELPEEGIELKIGQEYVFTTRRETYNGKEIPLTYKNLHKDVHEGHRFLIDDGLLELIVVNVNKQSIHARVINGGRITSHKGMNFPDSSLSVSAITSKDKADIVFAVEQGIDFIALSFVKNEQDVKQLRRLIGTAAKKDQVLPRVIVKIEKHEAIDRFEEILDGTDGVMIARGDLGVEIPPQQVPIRQKELIERCRRVGKMVIVATQMLDSMIRNPRPTRAEVSDVANAVFDHTDAVMLSGESANGKFPVQAVKMMSDIVKEAEASPFDDIEIEPSSKDSVGAVAQSIKLAFVQGTIDGVLSSIELADWSETIARVHPELPFFFACPSYEVARQVSLRWGSVAFLLKKANEKTFVMRAVRDLLKTKMVKRGTRLAVVIGGRHGEAFDVIEVK